MIRARNFTRAGFWLSAVAGTALAAAPVLAAPVTPERLLNAQSEPQNWLLPYGDYNNHNHSNLSQINRSNVGDLRVVFMQSIGGADFQVDSRFQTAPAVNDGFMYIGNSWGQVFKIDVTSGTGGKIVWINDPEVEEGTRMRGTVALLGNDVYAHAAQYDMRMIKMDASSGETIWEASTMLDEEEAARSDQRQTIHPIAIGDKLIAATTGTVRRNAVSAYSAEDGEVLWRFWTIPGPGEFGHETWAGDWDAYRTGGAAVWTQGAYDPETNLVYYGTGEPSPWYDPSYRPGDNLFSVSTIAINVDTGELGWYFQEIPDESWDYDTVNPRILYDITVDGSSRKVMATFSRNGFYYTLDRTNGDYLFAEPYTEVNWTAGLDPKTGMPVEYDPNALIQSYANNMSMVAGDPDSAQNTCPYFYGMPTLMPPTYDARNMMAYIGAQEGCFSQFLAEAYEHDAALFLGKRFGGRESSIDRAIGAIFAVDARTGTLVNKRNMQYSIYSGTLGTAGGLLFTAQVDGKIMALDKDTLSELWAFNSGTPISAPPITYSVDGKQYVAILTGGQNHQGLQRQEELALLQRSPSVIVFGL